MKKSRLMLCVFLAFAAGSAQPVFHEFTITKTSDTTGPAALRKALGKANANGGGTIPFAPGLAGTIVLTLGELRVKAHVTISGLGSDTLTISGNNMSRVFTIESPPGRGSNVVTISGLTIRDGFAGNNAVPPGKGGGIYVQRAWCSRGLESSTISRSAVVVQAGGGVYGTGSVITIAGPTREGFEKSLVTPSAHEPGSRCCRFTDVAIADRL